MDATDSRGIASQGRTDVAAHTAASPQGGPPPRDVELDGTRIPLVPEERRRTPRPSPPSAWPRVSVIVPTLNEAPNLPHVIGALPTCVDELVIVDGLSTDGTPEVAKALRPDARIVYERRSGKGNALRSGFAAASGDILVMLDGDGSADPQEIPAFIRALLGDADFAKGTRFDGGGGSADITGLRAAGNRLLGATVNALFRTSYTDLCYGYNAFWRHCLPAMQIDCNGFEIETLINIRVAGAGLTVREVPSFERERLHGQSNLRTFRDGSRVLRTIVRERVRRSRLRLDVEAEIDWLRTPSSERRASETWPRALEKLTAGALTAAAS